MSFVAELRRRGVLKVGLAYLVGGWLIIQVAATVFPQFDLPLWSPRLVTALVVLGLPVVLVLSWAYDLTPHGLERTARMNTSHGNAAAAAAGAPAIPADRGPTADLKAVGVLPFVNMSNDADQEYFSDGLTEELLNALAKVKDLRVAARTSSFAFKGMNMPISEIGAKLGVGAVVEGSVRRAGNQLRITAQLIAIEDGFHVWSETYDRPLTDVFAIQEEIAKAIARALCAELGAGVIDVVAGGTTSMAAHDLYLRGRYHLARGTEQDLRAANVAFRSAIELDPSYADPHTGIAEVYTFLADAYMAPSEAYPVCIAEAKRALEKNPESGDAWIVLGVGTIHYEWDFVSGERSVDRGLKINPSNALGHVTTALTASVRRRFDDAAAAVRAAAAVDPLSPLPLYFRGWIEIFRRNYDQVLSSHERLWQLAPGFFYVEMPAAVALRALGRPLEAMRIYDTVADAMGDRPMHGRAVTFAALGKLDEARAIVASLEAYRTIEYVAAHQIAIGHAAVGNMDKAIEWMRTAVREHDSWVLLAYVHPDFAPMWSDPRFADIAADLPIELQG